MNAEGDSEDLITRITALALGNNTLTTNQLDDPISSVGLNQQTVTVKDLTIKRDPGEETLRLQRTVWRVKQLAKQASSLSKDELVDKLIDSLKE